MSVCMCSGADHVVSSSLPGGGTSRWPHSVHHVKSAVLNCFLTDANGSRGGRVISGIYEFVSFPHDI